MREPLPGSCCSVHFGLHSRLQTGCACLVKWTCPALAFAILTGSLRRLRRGGSDALPANVSCSGQQKSCPNVHTQSFIPPIYLAECLSLLSISPSPVAACLILFFSEIPYSFPNTTCLHILVSLSFHLTGSLSAGAPILHRLVSIPFKTIHKYL